MTDQEKKLLNESLSKLYKPDPEILASLYNEAGELTDFSKILTLDEERIKKSKTESDNQYKRGIKEGAGKVEKELKEKYEVDSDLLGIDLIDHLVVKKVEEAKTSGTKDITKHPDFIKFQLDAEKKLKDRDKEWEQKIVLKDAEYNKAKLFEKVRERALQNLESRKPILPTDPSKALKWKDTFLNDLRQASYMENNGDIVVLDGEGKALTNAHGHTITFDEYEKDTADKYFEYQVSTDRSGSGNKPPAGAGTGDWNAPKTDEDYMARLRDPKITPAERVKLTEYWTTKK